MSRLPRLLPALAVLCLTAAANALPAQEAGDRAGRRYEPIFIGEEGRDHGKPGQGPWRGFPISLSLRDAPLKDVLRAFARLVGFNLVLHPKIPEATVTLEFRDVPWDLALHTILRVHGLGAEVDDRLWTVTPSR